MNKVFTLAARFLFERPARLALTTIATAAAVSLVIWISSGYEALEQTYDEYANLSLGRYELAVAPISLAEDACVARDAFEQLRGDAAVLAADPMDTRRLTIRASKAAEARVAARRAKSDASRGLVGGLVPVPMPNFRV